MKSDIELVLETKQGNQRAFSELVQRHQRSLLRLCLRFTREQTLAEDVTQEAFIKAYQKIAMFEGRSSFKSWLYQIAMNTAKNRFRERKFDMVSVEGEHLSQLAVDGAVNAESGMAQADAKRLIRAEVARLPDKQRIALTLRVFEDLSFKEIAQIMECPYDTAKANYRHALLKLRERFEENEFLSHGLETWKEFDHAIQRREASSDMHSTGAV